MPAFRVQHTRRGSFASCLSPQPGRLAPCQPPASPPRVLAPSSTSGSLPPGGRLGNRVLHS